jgi:hypothetical protein
MRSVGIERWFQQWQEAIPFVQESVLASWKFWLALVRTMKAIVEQGFSPSARSAIPPVPCRVNSTDHPLVFVTLYIWRLCTDWPLGDETVVPAVAGSSSIRARIGDGILEILLRTRTYHEVNCGTGL